MTPMSRRDLLRTAGAGAALLTLPSFTLAADPPAKGGGFTLPPLPYAFDALEPHIDAKTMEIHHDRHHKAYVDNLNKALAGTGLGRQAGRGGPASTWPSCRRSSGRPVRNNGGGHYNHTLFWQMMSPKGGKPPGRSTTRSPTPSRTWTGCSSRFKEAAMARFGSGWAWVVVQKGRQLAMLQQPEPGQPADGRDGHGRSLLGSTCGSTPTT